MIEVGNHPGGIGAVMLHSTESGQFLACDRIEFERLAAAIKRGDLDAFLGMREASAVADGSADWTATEASGSEDVPTCIRCGCTDEQACPGGCSWVPGSMEGDLCSRCAPDEDDGEMLVTLRVRVPYHLDAEQVSEVEAAARQWANEQYPDEDDDDTALTAGDGESATPGRSQCCPMDTYGTDTEGNLRAECSCDGDCDCTCLGCACRSKGWDGNDD
jgi:hypothetical protein